MHRFGLRAVIMLAVMVPWYLFDWGWAVKVTALTVTTALSPFIETAMTADGAQVIADGQAFVFGKECTYLDLFLASAPFAWRCGSGSARNVRRLLALASVIWVVDLVRVAGGIAASVQGVGWTVAHDLPDLLLYWPILGLIVFSSLRHELIHSRGSARERAPVLDPAVVAAAPVFER